MTPRAAPDGGRWVTFHASAPLAEPAVWPGDFPEGAPVEYLDDDVLEGVLRRGHPGRVADGSEQDIFVDWVGLESHMVSTICCHDTNVIRGIEEDEFARRVEALRNAR